MTSDTAQQDELPVEDASKPAPAPKPAPMPVQMPQPESAKVRVLSDRVLCATLPTAETRSRGGILIPATAESITKHGMWCTVEEIGPMVRSVHVGEKVLFLMDEAIQVDIAGTSHFIIRERDLHAAAAPQGEDDDDQGLYL